MNKDENKLDSIRDDIEDPYTLLNAHWKNAVAWLLTKLDEKDEQIKDLEQLAAGNKERTELLAKKHSGQSYDEHRLAALMELTSKCFNRVEDSLRLELFEKDREIERLKYPSQQLTERQDSFVSIKNPWKKK